jgi:hypothetical protein
LTADVFGCNVLMHKPAEQMAFTGKTILRRALAVSALALLTPTLSAQNECQCSAPGAESSRIANAIGGGLFAGLLAAVIPFHHAAALASAPPGAGGAPSALTQLSDSTDIAPADPAAPRQLASMGEAPTGEDGTPGGTPTGKGGTLLGRRARSAPASALPSITPMEAEAEGMIAPRTATMLPALAMIGVGALLTGIFFLRVRGPHRRSH